MNGRCWAVHADIIHMLAGWTREGTAPPMVNTPSAVHLCNIVVGLQAWCDKSFKDTTQPLQVPVLARLSTQSSHSVVEKGEFAKGCRQPLYTDRGFLSSSSFPHISSHQSWSNNEIVPWQTLTRLPNGIAHHISNVEINADKLIVL